MSRVWVTRTKPGADRLVAELDAHEVEAESVPVVEIESLPCVLPDGVPDLMIVTSAHAARSYLDGVRSPLQVPCLAVGRATQRALQVGGVNATRARPENSEGVLASGAVAALPRGASVWLLAGEGGRNLIVDRLTQAGVQIVKCALYRRRPVNLSRVDVVGFDVVEVSSRTALMAVHDRLERAGLQPLLVVASQRLFEEARVLGYPASLADSADVEDLASEIVRVAAAGR